MNINIWKSRDRALNDFSVRYKHSTINTTHLGYDFVILTMILKNGFNRLTCSKVTDNSNPPRHFLFMPLML